MPALEDRVKALALEIGFDRVGITGAEPFVRDEAAAIVTYVSSS